MCGSCSKAAAKTEAVDTTERTVTSRVGKKRRTDALVDARDRKVALAKLKKKTAAASSVRLKERWKDPEFKKKASDRMKKLWKDPEYAAKVMAKVRERWSDPEYVAKTKAALAAGRDAMRRKTMKIRSVIMKRRWSDPESAAKMKAALAAGVVRRKLSARKTAEKRE